MTEQKTYSMRMAKADKDDLEAAYQVMNLLDSMLNHAFTKAVEWGLLKKNPFDPSTAHQQKAQRIQVVTVRGVSS